MVVHSAEGGQNSLSKSSCQQHLSFSFSFSFDSFTQSIHQRLYSHNSNFTIRDLNFWRTLCENWNFTKNGKHIKNILSHSRNKPFQETFITVQILHMKCESYCTLHSTILRKKHNELELQAPLTKDGNC